VLHVALEEERKHAVGCFGDCFVLNTVLAWSSVWMESLELTFLSNQCIFPEHSFRFENSDTHA
jgi:hypothetical protein